MGTTDFFLSWQFGFTLLAALGIGVWQLWRVQRAKAKHTHSAMAERHGDHSG